jgi:hypothetical protein
MSEAFVDELVELRDALCDLNLYAESYSSAVAQMAWSSRYDLETVEAPGWPASMRPARHARTLAGVMSTSSTEPGSGGCADEAGSGRSPSFEGVDQDGRRATARRSP